VKRKLRGLGWPKDWQEGGFHTYIPMVHTLKALLYLHPLCFAAFAATIGNFREGEAFQAELEVTTDWI
jgi:hypothetical protein